ncbi:MAG: hypothetical protein M1839_004175 [Geoglossum umbratile]|nr:MAG: hypothetical protein M1839_004175 [Geoglossum umbratile]
MKALHSDTFLQYFLTSASPLDLTYFSPFVALFLFRYIRLIGNTISYWKSKPIPIPTDSTFSVEDVTVIIPTISRDHEALRRCIRSIVQENPFRVILVTPRGLSNSLTELVRSIDKSIEVLKTAQANKRIQIARALPEVTTKFVVLADDDVVWSSATLECLLALLEHNNVGAGGTIQRVQRTDWLNIWQYLGAIYIERRNFEIVATTNIDGGLSCLSGRTLIVRAEIVKAPDFIQGYTSERWQGRLLNTDDDNFVTRWLFSHEWEIRIQSSAAAVVYTTLEAGPKYWAQCERWSRSNWRSNYKSMTGKQHPWRKQPWSTYALYLVTPFHSLIIDPLLVYLLHRSIGSWDPRSYLWVLYSFACWLLITKVVKLVPHFRRNPRDACFIPISIVFGYLHGLIKYYTLFTLHVTAWGSRDVPGDLD